MTDTGSALGFQFLFNVEEVDAGVVAEIRDILQHPPNSAGLPGEAGVVWRTPRVARRDPQASPQGGSPGFEFGDGVSSLIKNLSVSGPSCHSHTPPAPSTAILSANSTPFVPSIPLPYSGAPPTPSIPIPIPNPLPGGAQGLQHIHINNFTANLNYHGMQNSETSPPQPSVSADQVLGGLNIPPQSMQFRVPPRAPPSQHRFLPPQHYQLPQGMNLAPAGYNLAQGPDGQFYYSYIQVAPPAATYPPQPHIAHQPPQAQEYSNGGLGGFAVAGQHGPGITFGSTPVVSVKKVVGTEEDVHQEDSKDSYVENNNSRNVRDKSNVVDHPTEIKESNQVSVNNNGNVNPGLCSQHSEREGAVAKHPPVMILGEVTLKQANKNPPDNNEQPSYIPQTDGLKCTQKKVDKAFTQTQDNESLTNIDDGISNESRNLPPVLPTSEESYKTAMTHETEKSLTESESTPSQTLEDKSPAPAPVSSWASLFSGKPGGQSGAGSTAAGSSKPTARIQPFTVGVGGANEMAVELGRGAREQELGSLLRDYILKHQSTALLPRGLTNRSNWCFVNAILQALLACPSFYNLMRSIPGTLGMAGGKSKTPMLDSMVEFVSEFSLLDLQLNKNMTGSGSKKDKGRKKEDLVTGVSLEPSYVYKMLLNLQGGTFKVIDGRQEDAEEFLTCLLNGLSEEMLGLIKQVAEDVDENVTDENVTDENDNIEDVADDWQEVGAKGKSCVTRRVADVSGASGKHTPIQSLALGMCRSCVKAEGGENSATLQPFYTLQLDIQESNILNVTDALLANFASEQLDGFMCAKTKKEVEATKSVSLEELPPILILHLKRFVYDGATGGVQKVMKQVGFDVDLEVPKTILSSECRGATNNRQRQYKLFSVVYHNGREATKGHYVTDVYHTGYGCWLHCDDSQVTPTSEQLVVQPGPSSTPYLLFYRRGDTMVGSQDRGSPGGRGQEGGR